MDAPEGRWVLTGTADLVSGREFLLVGEEIRIGRTPDNDIVVPDKNISKRHVLVYPRGKNCVIRDAGSKNGTFVNGKRIAETHLKENDLLKVGRCRFRLRWDNSTSEQEESPASPLPDKIKDLKTKALPWLSDMAAKARALGPRRLLMYGTVLGVLILVILSEFSPGSKGISQTVEAEKAVSPVPPSAKSLKPIQATEEEIESWRSRSTIALQRRDLIEAVSLLRKILAADVDDERARIQLARTEAELKKRIDEYYESGAREYEKLYFDRAIDEWRKVLAMAKEFDPDIYRQTEEKIDEARSRLTGKL